MVNGIFKTENLNSSIDRKRAPKSNNSLYGNTGYEKEFLIRDGVDVGRVWVGWVAAVCVLLGGEGRDGWSLKVRQG